MPRWTGLLALLTLALTGAASAQEPEAPMVEVAFIEVGQGDAVYIRSPEGHHILYDAGKDADILGWLDAWQVTELDLVVASHNDRDHIGGIEPVLRTLKVAAFLDNGRDHDSQTYRSLWRTVRQLGIPCIQPERQTFEAGSLRLTVLPPYPEARSSNDASVGLLVEYGEFRVLLTGDSEFAALQWFSQFELPHVTVLKAAHHGARNGVTPGWLQKTRPEVVVIQVGAGNSYGHPDRFALRYYGAVAKEIYRTDLHGTVVVQGFTDGSYRVVSSAVPLD